MKRFAVILLALALVLGCVLPASAAKKVIHSDAVNQLFKGWFYVPSTLPDWVDADTVDYDAGYYYNGERRVPDSWEVTLVSGDEWLNGALILTERTNSNGNRQVDLAVDNSKLTKPGHAVFKYVREFSDFIVEAEGELWVLSWDEYPLAEWLDEPVEYNTSVGETAAGAQIVACAAVTHKEEIAKAINAQAGRQVFDTYGEGFMFSNTQDMENGAISSYFTGEQPNGSIGYTFNQGGSYLIPLGMWFMNVESETRYVTVNVLPYYLSGPAGVRPGETVYYSVADTDEEAGRTFTLSLEGEGLSFDAETGEVTAPADAVPGTPYTVIATPSDGGPVASIQGMVDTGLLSGVEIGTIGLEDGFTAPLPSLAQTGLDYWSGCYYSQTEKDVGPNRIVYDVRLVGNDEYAENPENAVEDYDTYVASFKDLKITESKDVEIDGHPARLVVGIGGNGSNYVGFLIYTRSNQGMVARLFSTPQNGTTMDDVEKVTMQDMEKLADAMSYDATKAQILPEDGALTVTAKDGATALTAGKTLAFTASFASPEKLKLLNKKYKPDQVAWSVTDAETGEAPEGITIDAKGVLKADKSVAAVKKVTVTASSPVFMTSASAQVTVIPAVKKISVEPAELFFYVGTEASAEVKAVLDPDTVPPLGVTWTPAKAGIVEITPNEETGTAAFKPLAAGKTTVAVKEPGGKNAKLTVSVVDPVTGLELAVSGKPKPGATVTVKETLQPKTAGNKNVEWTLDVSEDIATVSKGKVKISKDAPAGTVITVTCTAVGAPEPVIATAQITVE